MIGDMRDLDQKLAEFDQHANKAVQELHQWLAGNQQAFVTQARGRLVAGHWRFRDRYMYELSEDELRAEAAEELADAVNYLARWLALSAPV